MSGLLLRALILLTGVTSLVGTASTTRTLTFEDRVRAQEAIERVYYSHQIGATKLFEEAVPREVLERKVRTYLERSAALGLAGDGPATAAALQRELRRIVSSTRLPGRLDEVFEALRHDPVLILECFVRPALVDRLGRSASIAGARSLHDSRVLPPELLRSGPAPTFAGLDAAPSAGSQCLPDDTWAKGMHLGDDPEARWGHVAVWTGSLMLVWGGEEAGTYSNTGSRYDPASDTWSEMSTLDAPSGRISHKAVWTGSEMIVWGGFDGSGSVDTGGRYDPSADTWVAVSTVDAPVGRTSHTMVWTGTAMIVWGGVDNTSGVTLDSGGRYDPISNIWVDTATPGAPIARGLHQAVWTGNRMVVWGGSDGLGTYLDTGGRYDPSTDSWESTSIVNAPAPRQFFSAVWTGTEMIVWGGEGVGLEVLDTGGRYDPGTDTWISTSTAATLGGRVFPGAAWTGDRMMVWGGFAATGASNVGGLYDPAGDTWTTTSTLDAPVARVAHSLVWTGARVIVWGGSGDIGALGSGGRYDPATDTWTPTASVPAPVQRRWHSAVWTGNLMIVWGGIDSSSQANHLDSGGRYDPLIDTWSPTSTLNAPAPRRLASSVWTGTEMVIWGGSGSGFLNTGGRYDPIADTWRPTSTLDAPAGREWHTTVWTGREMIVWGGYGTGGADLNTGGRYDPATDTWSPTSTLGAPTVRRISTAAWTGREMILWGGSHQNGYLNTGGRYDPATDTWLATSTAGAPSPRRLRASVWAGSDMVVWGGFSDFNHGSALDTGGRYSPATDTWAPVSTVGRPTAREDHTLTWTGSEMVVWGGKFNSVYPVAGGRYEPSTDSWRSTSTVDAPIGRAFHTAVWTGAEIIVWGGDASSAGNSGGRYSVGRDADDDHDGFSVCLDDCNDSDPTINPGAAEACNGVDDDCDGTVPAGELDDDGDGFRGCQNDCSDSDSSVNPLAVELPGNATDENCDGVLSCDPSKFYKTHGQFVSCVSRACDSLITSGLIPQAQCDALISDAAQSNVGRRQRTRAHPAPAEP